MSDVSEISADTVRKFIDQRGFTYLYSPQVADRSYVAPSRAWLDDVFGPALHKLTFGLGINTWLAEVNDCDDFARFSAAYAGILHKRSSGRPGRTGLLFGEFWYTSQVLGGGHAINAAIVAGATGAAEMIFFEPQQFKCINLTQDEVDSCFALRF